jgi:hypothetical protein
MMMLFHIWGCDLICFWKDVVCVWGSLSSSPYDIGCHKGVHSGSYDFTRLPLLLLHSIACKPSLEAAKIKSSLYSNNYFLWYAPWCPTPECSWIGTVLITWKGVRTCKVLTELRASFQLCGLLMCSLIRQSAPLQDSIKLQLSSRDPSAYDWLWLKQHPQAVANFVRFLEKDNWFTAVTSMYVPLNPGATTLVLCLL